MMTGLHVVALYLLMGRVGASEFSVDGVATVTVAVLRHYMAPCVYLPYPTNQPSEYLDFVSQFESRERRNVVSCVGNIAERNFPEFYCGL
jgi:hypothetical protein